VTRDARRETLANFVDVPERKAGANAADASVDHDNIAMLHEDGTAFGAFTEGKNRWNDIPISPSVSRRPT
jgi:hypothetical protein